ncbi:hypothetical protein PN398_08090 [Romboutsia sp. 1001216sp1]|uniref:hypothetical protein n=1 Tax=unclassified Romboutsia TaxID=2626894 RepID=UPI0018A066B8|nr:MULTISPECIES: hypothetical protein [unclassified Romboutsia]MDB8790679.1 hypothetical protein [Romboutsia sp. 1001216sp1]MDB8803242.1 hypothetical protein [Romboutsia sp. 1001216sp1]MDB8814594.1 hypothetical protein [Romboutsia sp. 1001216sp1]
MSYNYKIWNKIDKINNLDAQYYLDEFKIQKDDEVFLIINNVGKVERVEISNNIKSTYNLNPNLSVEQVAQEYLRIKEEEKNNSDKKINYLNKLNESNANLLKDSAAKSIEINNLKKHNATILIDNANKTKQINNINKNLATVTLELAKLKAQK